MRSLTVARETWPIRGSFTLSRGSKSATEVVVVKVIQDGIVGRGECVPYSRYGETIEGVTAQIEGLAPQISHGLDLTELQKVLPAGAARNALDCALWDLDAKVTGVPVWRRAGLMPPAPALTAFTISLGSPQKMAQDAADAAPSHPLLKLKFGGDGDLARLSEIRKAVPDARLIVDANEAWALQHIVDFGAPFADLGVELIEQPLSADKDHELANTDCPVPFCADESCHDTKSLKSITGKYQFVNVKLDKTGGLTEALNLINACQQSGIGVMVGCMVATSLAMAPATLLTGCASYVDLDGPLLLAKDREPGLTYANSQVSPPSAELWG